MASFGKSGLVRTAFDGPGGTGGTCIAVQSIGSPFRKLKQGRLVYLDIPCGVEGYHTDKTIVYYFGDINKDPNRDLILAAHEHCLMLERFAASCGRLYERRQVFGAQHRADDGRKPCHC